MAIFIKTSTGEEFNLNEFKEIKGYPNYLIRKDGVILKKPSDSWINYRKLSHFRKTASSDINVVLHTANGNRSIYLRKLIEDNFPSISLEKFKPIPGYEDFYMISTDGEVYSLRNLKILSTSINNTGYKQINLSRGGRDKKSMMIHHLVLMAFKPEEYKKIAPLSYRNNTRYKSSDVFVTNHIDGDKLNNRLDNLEVITASDNNRHAIDTGLRSKDLRPVTRLTVSTGEIKNYKSVKDCADDNNLTYETMASRLSRHPSGGKMWKEGYRFAYAENVVNGWSDNYFQPDEDNRGVALLVMDFKNNCCVTKYKDIATYCKLNNLSESGIAKAFNKNSQPLLTNLHLLKKEDDLNEWRDIGDPYLELNNVTPNKFVNVVVDEQDPIPFISIFGDSTPYYLNRKIKHYDKDYITKVDILNIAKSSYPKLEFILDVNGIHVFRYHDFVRTEYYARWRKHIRQLDKEKLQST